MAEAEPATTPYLLQLVHTVATLFDTPSLLTIEEVGIFQSAPPPPRQRSLATALQHTDNRVGLASWTLTPFYLHCKQRLLRHRGDFAAATSILLASPDFLTAWNVRKCRFTRTFRENGHAAAAAELHFCYLVLTRAPKSAETWAHRHWLIRTLGLCHVPHATELRLAWLAATRVFSNYYATVHRLHVLPALDTATLVLELAASRKWLRTHCADSSGWTYHRALLVALSAHGVIPDLDEETWFEKMCGDFAAMHQNIAVHSRWLITPKAQAVFLQPL